MRRLAVLSLFLALFSCAGEDRAGDFEPIVACSEDAECFSGQACVNFVCVDAKPGVLRDVHLEITPPLESGYLRSQRIRQTIATGTERLRFELPRPTRFESLRVLDATDAPIAARVIISGDRNQRIKGRELDLSLRLTTDRESSVELNPGLYEVRVLPEDVERHPALEVNDWEVKASDFSEQREFVLPSDYRRIRGEVTLSTMNSVKLDGVTVRAFSQLTQMPSTSSISGNGGRFSISLPETADNTFILTAERAGENGPSWRFEQTVIAPDSGSRNVTIRFDETTDDVRGQVQLRILGRSEADIEPVAGAKVTITASTGVESRRLTVEATTDISGNVYVQRGNQAEALRLIAANYLVEIEPPPPSRFRRKKTVLNLTDLGPKVPADEQVLLDVRPIVRGRITAGSGDRLTNASLEIRPLDGSNKLFTAASDAEGLFEVRLDPGSYGILIFPTLPALGRDLAPVKWAQIDVPDQQSVQLLTISLEEGTLIRGEVVGPGGETIPGSEVELFEQAGERVNSLGRARSDNSGQFLLVVPLRP